MFKYPRTYHLPNSPGKTSDDKSLPDYSIFENKNVVITFKMDGENTTGYSTGHIHARSLDSKNHESRNWVKNHLTNKLKLLPPGWRVCGENLFAKHSIWYKYLESYFYLFSIWDENNNCLNWVDTKEWAELLELKLADIINIGPFDKNFVTKDLPYWGCFGKDLPVHEGFVIRNSEAFKFKDFSKNVAKWVRENHVQTDNHWMHQKIVKNLLK